jgi:hypothetical protein
LTAALFGAGTLLVDQRPATAGLLFGMLCYKPHFGLLVPIALVAGRRWKAVIGAVASAGLLVTLSVVLFGRTTWQAYLGAFFGSAVTSDFEIERHVNIFASISPFAAAQLLGLSAGHARIVQLVATLFVALLVGWVWGKNFRLPIRAAVLASGAVVAVPYALLYDLMISAIAGCWLIRAGCEGGFLPREKLALMVVYILPLFAFQTGMALHLPLGPCASALLLLLCASRAWQEHQGRHRPVASTPTN